MRSLQYLGIGGRKPFVVAEVGQNHNGDVYTAIRLVSMAVKAGASAVKFQYRDCEREFSAAVLDAPHPEPNRAYGPTYREHRRALDLSFRDLDHIRRRILYNEWGIPMFVTPCHVELVDELEQVDWPMYKVASKDLTNRPLIERLVATGRPLILSTGMATLSESLDALGWTSPLWPNVVVCHSRSEYPCPVNKANLSSIRTLKREMEGTGCQVGYSDHTGGVLAAPLAVSLGATYIEVHVTLSRLQAGDHAASLERDGLRRVVRDCRRVRRMLGKPSKKDDSDVAARAKMGYSGGEG